MSIRGTVRAEACMALGAGAPRLQAYPGRELSLGALPVSRALPVRERRLVGPWCFLDRFGPLSFGEGTPMDVAPHPHIGLQTITWLVAGEIGHDDSLGCESVLRPGGVHVMTAGSGIAHAERTPRDHSGRLNGVQLWVALPDPFRHVAPTFAHVTEAPAHDLPGATASVFAGSFGGVDASTSRYSDQVGAELRLQPQRTVAIPLQPGFEHAVLVLGGDCVLDGERLESRLLYYLGTTRSEATLSSRGGARVLLIGGPPFPEPILMWWNFVARTPEEIADARRAWEERRRFGEVAAYPGPRLRAPSLDRFARPNAVS